MRDKIYIIIPAYNEARTICKVVNDVEKYVDKIIVVDDGSNDGTAEPVKSKKAIVLKHLVNLGQGAAQETGFEYARMNSPDIVITYDADDQFVASEIPSMTKPILENKADVVLGSRFLGKTINMPLSRRLVLKLGIIFTYFFSGMKLTDTHLGFRALNKKALSLIRLTQNGTAHASEFIDEIRKHKLRFVEVPITVKYSKYSLKKGQKNSNVFKILFDLIIDIIK